MNAKYRELFTLIARTTSNLAEEVMNLHKQNEEEKEFKTAQVMRDDYLNLHDKLTSEEALTKADFARILVGAIIVAKNGCHPPHLQLRGRSWLRCHPTLPCAGLLHR